MGEENLLDIPRGYFGDHKMDRLIYVGPRGTTQMELHNSLKKTQIATCAVEILAGHQKPKHPTTN